MAADRDFCGRFSLRPFLCGLLPGDPVCAFLRSVPAGGAVAAVFRLFADAQGDGAGFLAVLRMVVLFAVGRRAIFAVLFSCPRPPDPKEDFCAACPHGKSAA